MRLLLVVLLLLVKVEILDLTTTVVMLFQMTLIVGVLDQSTETTQTKETASVAVE